MILPPHAEVHRRHPTKVTFCVRGVIAPLLANLYLHPLDRLLVAAGHVPVRYSDDFVVLAADRQGLERARRLAEGVLGERGLKLVPNKTRMVAPGNPLRFLGVVLVAWPAAVPARLP